MEIGSSTGALQNLQLQRPAQNTVNNQSSAQDQELQAADSSRTEPNRAEQQESDLSSGGQNLDAGSNIQSAFIAQSSARSRLLSDSANLEAVSDAISQAQDQAERAREQQRAES